MEIKQIGKIVGGQDGAIFGGLLFRFSSRGQGYAYDLSAVDAEREGDGIVEPLCSFTLDKAELIAPHSNAVFFGTERYEEGDELPLLYSNIYNNYSSSEDRLIGVCCVYRVERTEESFKTTLVQLIEIGFTEDAELWRAYPDRDGVRPYGNFLIDRDTGDYYAFVMRSEEPGTRYFKFKAPSVRDGVWDEKYGVRRVTLTALDIVERFDCPYHRYIQGATLHGGKIYSTEGFSNEDNRPAIRIIDLKRGVQEEYIDLWEMGYRIEPELIDFDGEDCYYSDNKGNLFLINW